MIGYDYIRDKNCGLIGDCAIRGGTCSLIGYRYMGGICGRIGYCGAGGEDYASVVFILGVGLCFCVILFVYFRVV